MLAILGVAVCTVPLAARAQDISKHYYHVEQATTGCQNPAAVRLLTNSDETAQADAKRLRSIRNSGHCVTITPRSQWSYLWRENDVAMMSYAGSIGRPGSYYLKVEDLVDANGQHPGELDVDASPVATTPNTGDDAVASTAAATPSVKAAEVPTIIPPAVPPQVASTAAPNRSIDQLIDKAGASPAFTPPQGNSPPAGDADSSSQIWVPAICLALVVGALGLYAALRGRNGKTGNYEPAIEIALGEIQAQATALRDAKAESTRPDRYGTLRSDGWEQEKSAFINSRIAPRLRGAGYENMLPALLPAIDTEIERRANALVDPSLPDVDRGPEYLNGADRQAVDTELSDYASHCTSLLQNAGWTTDPSPAAYSKAVDIFAERDGRRLLLQCKGGAAPVGVEAVQQVFTLKDRRHADIAAIITHAPFTRAAQQMASANGVHALHDEDLMQLIR
ncbi:MAG TPA: restriction endonuclease [Alphaproteobacteria bacterium]|nr:restriction endonuclease [Alphaproteobacteria bacterium]